MIDIEVVNDELTKPWYQVKQSLVDRGLPFDFKLVSFRNTGYLFLGTAIVAPFLISILMSFLFKNNSYALLGTSFVSWIIVGVGAYFVLSQAREKLIRTGAVAFYYFYFIPNIIAVVAGMIISPFKLGVTNLATANLIVGVISSLTTIITLILTSPYVFRKIRLTLKEDYKRVIVLALITIVCLFGINFVFGYAQSFIGSSTSENQNNLTKGLDKWWNVILLAFYTILLAPLIEELACRHGIFALIGNKWIAFFASAIYFAGMHVSSNGDWEHLVGYLGTSFALAGLFVVVSGNVTYNIIGHAGLNTITLIFLLVLPNLVK